jgi:drug/metabolite transporter (DMT)-like permease
MPNLDRTVVIRSARSPDGDLLDGLARLDSQRPLAGDVLVAEQDGELVAALAGDRVIADPFRPTADVVALLRVRAGRTRGDRRHRRAPARAAPARCVNRSLLPRPSAAGAASPQAPAAIGARASRPRAPSGVLVWAALWTVYIVWGSTYLALRVLVETIPPLVSTGSRFLLAGTLMLGVLALRNRSVRITRREALSCTLVGSLLMGAVATVATAEQDVPSNLAALLVACVPLWVLLLRRLGGEQIAPRLVLAVVIGFAGVGLLLQPGGQSGGAPLLSLLLVVCSTPAWATGSYLSSRVALPSHPLVSVGWQMLLGGSVVTLAGVVAGEPWALDPSTFSTDSMIAWLYLTVIGSGSLSPPTRGCCRTPRSRASRPTPT